MLFLRQPDQLTGKERQSLELLCQIHEEVDLAYQLVQQFALMLRTRQGGQLDAWLEKVTQSPLQDLHSFAKGVRLDIEAVEAGLILPWSRTDGRPDYPPETAQEARVWKGKLPFHTLRKRVLYRAS